jgi:hypothetical protein
VAVPFAGLYTRQHVNVYIPALGAITILLATPLVLELKLVALLGYASFLSWHANRKVIDPAKHIIAVSVCVTGGVIAYLLTLLLEPLGIRSLSVLGLTFAASTSVLVDACMTDEPLIDWPTMPRTVQ